VALVRFCIDIDGTICHSSDLDYSVAEPIESAVTKIRELKQQGHYVILFTARGTMSGIDWRPVTELQLESWGVPYDELHFGKPAADIYIDDKGLTAHIWHQL
jgi:CMP-N,N'-diacetyllegionaminic acid synthase